MTWTYDTSLGTTRDEVRLLIGDTDTTAQLFSDEEIAAVLASAGSPRAAAAELALNLSARYARKADVGSGPLSVSWSQVSKEFAELAARLRSTGGTSVPVIVVGGSSRAQQQRMRTDTDLIQPDIRRGRFTSHQPDDDVNDE